MSEQNKDENKLAEELTKALVDAGRLVEAGWVGMRLGCKLDKTSLTQQTEMRRAFFAGAMHVFTSMMSFLEPGSNEPTEKDMDRMTQLSEELTRFQKELEAHIRSRN